MLYANMFTSLSLSPCVPTGSQIWRLQKGLCVSHDWTWGEMKKQDNRCVVRCGVAFVVSNGRGRRRPAAWLTVLIMDIRRKGNINILLTQSIRSVSPEGSLRTGSSPLYRCWRIFKQTGFLPNASVSLNKVNSTDRFSTPSEPKEFHICLTAG